MHLRSLTFQHKYLPLRAPEGAAGGAGAGDGGAAAAAAAVGQPWHTGVEAETVGFWQNKGYDLSDPKKFAEGITKSYREAEKHFGVPPDRLLTMPKPDAKPDEIAAFHQRLGAPKDVKEYDLTGVKFNGEDLDPAFADAMRGALAQAFVPKDKAAGIVGAVVKYLESADAAEATITTAKLAEEKGKLAKSWGTGPKYDFNHLQAMEGARRLGITPEAVKALESQIGYADVMEAMRKIGQSTSEDTFVETGTSGGNAPRTREGAIARKAELMADKAWADRYLAGSVAERQEMDGLNIMIDGNA